MKGIIRMSNKPKTQRKKDLRMKQFTPKDILAAKDASEKEAGALAMLINYYCMHDMYNMDAEELHRFGEKVKITYECIREKRVKYMDIVKVMQDELGVSPQNWYGVSRAKKSAEYMQPKDILLKPIYSHADMAAMIAEVKEECGKPKGHTTLDIGAAEAAVNELKKSLREIAEVTMETATAYFMSYLREKHRFGKKRIEEALEYVTELSHRAINGDTDPYKIAGEICRQTGCSLTKFLKLKEYYGKGE